MAVTQAASSTVIEADASRLAPTARAPSESALAHREILFKRVDPSLLLGIQRQLVMQQCVELGPRRPGIHEMVADDHPQYGGDEDENDGQRQASKIHCSPTSSVEGARALGTPSGDKGGAARA